MDTLITQIPTTLTGIFALVLVIIAGGIYLANRIRSGDLQLLRETNEDLRKAHNDNDEKIKKLIEDVKSLTEKVAKLEHEKKGLETLVIEALELYFQRNPEQAKKLRK